MIGLVWLALGCPLLAAQPSGEVRGYVVDARGGEALARVEIQLVGGAYRALTDSAGRFSITRISPGEYTLNVSTVGYRLAKRPFRLDAGEVKEFEVILSPDTFRHTETVEVKEDPFEPTRQDSPSSLMLAGDPLRAVQCLPGVTSNDDFETRFSINSRTLQANLTLGKLFPILLSAGIVFEH